jgi:hypothetical protein
MVIENIFKERKEYYGREEEDGKDEPSQDL